MSDQMPERWQPRPPERNPSPTLSDEERTQWLAQQVDTQLRDGWQIESRTEHVATFRKGQPVNHVLHLLLSVFTLGLWLPVWVLVAIFGD